VNYWQQKESLPATLEELNDPLANWQAPTDPQTGASYEHKRYSPLDFGLCATFAQERADMGNTGKSIAMPAMAGAASDNWSHGAGEQCFDRSIDPERYPPFKKNQ
jgi:hypothetical protein